MILKIQLTPQAPYFLGTERNFPFADNQTQKTRQGSYFLKSADLPGQSALFGVLRYLGIASPDVSYRLTQTDRQQIGPESFDLMKEGQSFGKINRISPIMLCSGEKTYLPAPVLSAIASSGKAGRENRYTCVQTGSGLRWLPEFYDEKTADFSRYCCLETGELIDRPFTAQVRVGINRALDDNGFFKKQYVVLNRGFHMVFYADVRDDFKLSDEKIVSIGQGRTPFSAQVTRAEKMPDYRALGRVFPDTVTVNGKDKTPCYACLVSDTFWSGAPAQLQKACMLMLGTAKEYRVFTTNYDAQSAVGTKDCRGRYRKAEKMLHLLPAGTTFLFQNAGQMEEFQTMLEGSAHFDHGKTAGFNHVIYISKGEDDR